jgi:hypothetical protein
VVSVLFRGFSKGADANPGVVSQTEKMQWADPSMGADEIDSGKIGRRIKIRREVPEKKLCIGEICGSLEGSAGEIDFAMEVHSRERNQEKIRS